MLSIYARNPHIGYRARNFRPYTPKKDTKLYAYTVVCKLFGIVM